VEEGTRRGGLLMTRMKIETKPDRLDLDLVECMHEEKPP